MSGPSIALFVFGAVIALIGAVITVAARRPLRAAVGLLIHIIALAGIFLTLHAELLAVIQVLVYAGAVVVLFVFVIMLIGPDSELPPAKGGWTTAAVNIALSAGVLLMVTFALARFSTPWDALPDGFGSVESVGLAIYREALVPFELVSVALLVAIIGAVAVAQARTPEERKLIAQRKEDG